jgi:AcrR family transcriptional regulator
MSTAVAPRHTAEERREEILHAAVARFGETGLHGTSTETIARDVGVSQPYLFRLYGTKKQLFMAAVEWGFSETLKVFRAAIAQATDPHDAFRRVGDAYFELVSDRRYLGIQMQSYASTDDPEIREAVQRGFGRLVTEVQAATDATPQQIAGFFGRGMLLNVTMSMGVIDQEDGWPALIREGCIGGFEEL